MPYNLQTIFMFIMLLYTEKNTMLYIHKFIYKYTIVQKYEFTCLSLHDITFEIGLNHMSLLLMSIMAGTVISFIDFLG